MAIDTKLNLLINRRTKIVATIGPASDSAEMIQQLLDAGVDVFRLNMSHGDQSGHRRVYERIRKLAKAADKHTAILADFGPKIRIGVFPDGPIQLVKDETITITTRDVPGQTGLIPSQYKDISKDVSAGDRILLADGLMELRVLSVEDTEISCTVVQGGTLSDRKGINLPGVDVSAPSLTDKDIDDAQFAMALGVDFLAQSFVRRRSDVQQLKDLINESGYSIPVIAKIERSEALANVDDILDIADAIMVARGDLGVELPPEEVPVAQHLLVDHARAKNRPVIIATQMLESMIDNPRPTRAEVADVSHSAFSGADAVMLSAETAAGSHPVQAVQMMDRIARQAEAYLWREHAFGEFRTDVDEGEPPIPFGDAVARSTALLSRDLMVQAIVAISSSGMSATTVSSARPAAPVIAVSHIEQTCCRINLMWGVIPVLAKESELADPIALCRRLLADIAFANPGNFALMVRGFHADPVLNTPSITLISV